MFGFCLGLFVDTALLQTLGVNSLVYTAVGYGAGRVRELRDPAHALAPVAIGAAATAIATIGFSMLQFLLGVEAPVSLLLVRQILMTIVLNTLLALPVYMVVPPRAARRTCPTIRAAAAAARTRPAGSVRCSRVTA